MKKILLLVILILTGSMIIWSQVPQAMTYKAVAKDDWGVALPNKTITLRFSILEGSGTGDLVYQEKHTTTTNKFGLMDVEIGKGTPLIGSFDEIEWSTGTFYIQIEMDPNGGTNFRLEDPAHQLLSVPYALYALKSGSADETGDMELSLQQILDEILELKSSTSTKLQEILDILKNDESTSLDNIVIVGNPDKVFDVPTSTQLMWFVSNPDWGPPLDLPIPSLMYDVYLGTTDNTTQVGSNLILESLTINNLQFNTTYYWRVVIKDDYNHTKSSEIWHFTTETDSDDDGYGESQGDCDDNNSNVFPTQLNYFTIPYNGSFWDYDCNGTAELQFNSLYIHCETDGWKTAIPQCGDSGEYIVCVDGVETTTLKTQGCR